MEIHTAAEAAPTSLTMGRRKRRLAAWAAPLLVVVALAACVPAEPGEALKLLNKDRKALNLPEVKMDSTYQAKANAHAAAMASAGRLYHSNMGLAPGLCAWGENVGKGTSLAAVQLAWMNSAVHRGNISTRRFDWVGIGVAKVGNMFYVVQIFIDRC